MEKQERGNSMKGSSKNVVPPDGASQPQMQKEEVLRPLEQSNENAMKNNTKIIIGVYVLLILLGVGTGYILSTRGLTAAGGQKVSVVTSGNIVGSTDTSTFKDSAIGVIQKGGAEDGEGSHKLIRDGGPSQTAYLVSSVVDLDKYVGKKVKVWGQTMTAKNVSWLMDVGKVELISE